MGCEVHTLVSQYVTPSSQLAIPPRRSMALAASRSPGRGAPLDRTREPGVAAGRVDVVDYTLADGRALLTRSTHG